MRGGRGGGSGGGWWGWGIVWGEGRKRWGEWGRVVGVGDSVE